MTQNSKEVVNPEWYKITGVGLEVTGQPSWDEYQDEFIKWSLIHRASAFAIGDLLAYGERRWGETYAQVSALTTLSPEYLYNVKYVCEKVPYTRRHEGLSFSHHQAVAAVKDPDQQVAWLEHADKNELTRDELRREIARGLPPPISSSIRNEGKQVVVQVQRETLQDIVAHYIQAKRSENAEREKFYYRMMESLVGDLL